MQIMIYSRNQSYQRQITRHIIASGVPSMGKLEIDLKKKRGGGVETGYPNERKWN